MKVNKDSKTLAKEFSITYSNQVPKIQKLKDEPGPRRVKRASFSGLNWNRRNSGDINHRA